MRKALWGSVTLVTVIILAGLASAQKSDLQAVSGVIWEPADIKTLDLYHGPGGSEMKPDLKNAVVIEPRPRGGANLKYRIRDRHGNEWVAKMAEESRPEVAAVRLLWAVGYKTEINYIVPDLVLPTVRPYRNVRLEARPKGVKRGEIWSWNDNPFKGTRELDGLKIMMALFNNWDLKDENNVILMSDGRTHYVISDLGASFGKLANAPGARSGRSINDPEDYASSPFIKGAHDGIIEFAYKGIQDHLMKDISVANARWIADLLLQLSDRQIMDAFRAANYSDEKAAIFATAFRARIQALDRATQGIN